MNASILLWTDKAPHPLADTLMKAEFRVWEALAISEVMALCESNDIDAIVITSKVDDRRCAELKQHHPAIKLQPHSNPANLIETLW
jgi:hypothetical protein